jgi:hypothetical protein
MAHKPRGAVREELDELSTLTYKLKFVQFQVLQETDSSAGGLYGLDADGQLWFSAHDGNWNVIDQEKK